MWTIFFFKYFYILLREFYEVFCCFIRSSICNYDLFSNIFVSFTIQPEHARCCVSAHQARRGAGPRRRAEPRRRRALALLALTSSSVHVSFVIFLAAVFSIPKNTTFGSFPFKRPYLVIVLIFHSKDNDLEDNKIFGRL